MGAGGSPQATNNGKSKHRSIRRICYIVTYVGPHNSWCLTVHKKALIGFDSVLQQVGGALVAILTQAQSLVQVITKV